MDLTLKYQVGVECFTMGEKCFVTLGTQVTLFSAPNYCGEFDNAGGMMSVDETLMCSFQVTILLTLICFICFSHKTFLLSYAAAKSDEVLVPCMFLL
jgi:hypothetical protein